MSDENINIGKILFYLGNSGSSGFRRIIDLDDLAAYSEISLNKLKNICKKLKCENKIDYEIVKKNKAIMRLKPKYNIDRM